MKPSLKLWSQVVEADYVQHPAWTNLYAPDEMELLTRIGFNEEETNEALEAIDWSEDYAFPLPPAGAALPFMRLRISASVTTKGGTKLVGYLGSHSVAVFHEGKAYSFNRALKDLSLQKASRLSAVLGGESIFPLSIVLPTLGETRSFSLV